MVRLLTYWDCHRFFNDVFQTGKFGSVPHLLRAFLDGDSYLALPFNIQALDEIVSFVQGGVDSD